MAAVVSDMSQPLGRMVGNALEVREALDTLAGEGLPEFAEFAIELASEIVRLATHGERGRDDVQACLDSGAARSRLRDMIVAQGGNPAAFDNSSRLPSARLRTQVLASNDGYLARLDALTVARSSIILGAGRERKGDPIDLAVGVELQAKIGDRLNRGQPLAILHANDEARQVEAERIFSSAVTISTDYVAPPPLILERLSPS